MGTAFDALAVEVRKGTHCSLFDVTEDGSVNTEDHRFWVNDLMGTFFGDADLDGEFNSGDLVDVFKTGEYDDTVEGNSGWAEGDWDGDGDFTSGDLVVAFKDGGYEKGPRPALATVPEPSGIGMMTIALALVAVSSTRGRGRRS